MSALVEALWLILKRDFANSVVLLIFGTYRMAENIWWLLVNVVEDALFGDTRLSRIVLAGTKRDI